jgi:tetratricopeptide (TPR) repeat protein
MAKPIPRTPNMRRGGWRALTENGIALIRQGQPHKALNQLLQAERLAPGARDVRYWLANAYRMTGETNRALNMLRQLLAETPGDLDASFALAFLLRDAGTPSGAAEALLTAARQPAVTVHQLLQITGFLRDSNQFVAAIEVCERAVELSPGQADLHFKLARLYQATGSFDLALDRLRKALDLQPSLGPAWTVLAQQKHFGGTGDADFQRILTAAGQSHDREADMCIAFAYGKALDDMGQCPEAWAQYQKGNKLMSKTVPWSRNAWRKFVTRSITRTGKAESATPAAGRNAVFIVDMPRSGTTLLEQMLDRHPGITGRGELNFLPHFAQQRMASGPITGAQRKEMADALWTQLRLEGPETGIYIDKNPLNFRYLDVLFEFLPTAKVLHVSRDGRASCLSCFFQPFQHEDTAFSYSLDHLLDFYSGYRRMMAGWEKIYADRIHRVNYDELVNSSAEVLSKTLRFLGTEWDDAVMQTADQERVVRSASAWQARQPVHTKSIERWSHYYHQAPEFFDRLSAIDSDHDAEIADREL